MAAKKKPAEWRAGNVWEAGLQLTLVCERYNHTVNTQGKPVKRVSGIPSVVRIEKVPGEDRLAVWIDPRLVLWPVFKEIAEAGTFGGMPVTLTVLPKK